MAHMREQGVQIGIHFHGAHEFDFYRALPASDLPVTEERRRQASHASRSTRSWTSGTLDRVVDVRVDRSSRRTDCSGIGHDEPPAPVAHRGHLCRDLVLEVPGQDQRRSRAASSNMCSGAWIGRCEPGRKRPCLCGEQVDRVRDELAA